MSKAVRTAAGKQSVIWVSDANTVSDVAEALRGSGMFPPDGGQAGSKRAVVLDGVFLNEEMRRVVLDALPHMKRSDEVYFMLEGKLDAATRKTLEKHSEISERFDTKKEKKGGEIFSLAYALKGGDKKRLWVEYQRALAREDAPEAIHGVLFWGAKDAFLKSAGVARERAGKLVAELAELPHEARRQGFELEYALEQYILGFDGAERGQSINKS